jgi:hypothetical protein
MQLRQGDLTPEQPHWMQKLTESGGASGDLASDPTLALIKITNSFQRIPKECRIQTWIA